MAPESGKRKKSAAALATGAACKKKEASQEGQEELTILRDFLSVPRDATLLQNITNPSVKITLEYDAVSLPPKILHLLSKHFVDTFIPSLVAIVTGIETKIGSAYGRFSMI